MRLRLPWLPFSLIDELDRVVGAESCVLEYGGGGSTLWFLDQGARVTTVEHHPGWARQLRAAISADRWTLLERSLGDGGTAYVDSVRELEDETFDIILVDGRERCRCALAAMDKLKPGGLLVFDDVDRERYREGLRAIAWPRTDYIGFAPAKPTLAYTATFKKPRVDD